jgi:tetratricopeptide (TPR) repeat protein
MKNITVIDNKEKSELKVTRLAVYNVCKIIEAVNEKGECFYLFFYKDQFLTGKKAAKLKRHSHIEKVFKNGILFSSPHPLVHKLTEKYSSFTLQSFTSLWPKLEATYTPQETALIFTFFDSFIKKEKIVKIMKNSFYDYRRNGQLFLAYQIIHILKNFAPKYKWAYETANSLQFHKFMKIYEENSTVLQTKDPLYTEQFCFSHRAKDENFFILQTKLSAEKRWIDLIGLYVDHISSRQEPSLDVYQKLLSLLPLYLSEEESTTLLHDLYKKVPHFQPLQNNLFHTFMKHHLYEEAIHLAINKNITPSEIQLQQLTNLLDNGSITIDKLNVEKMNDLPIKQLNPTILEKILRICVPRLLSQYDLSYVSQWLSPFYSANLPLPILQQIHTMIEIKEDPDQQLFLGEYYYEFNQLEKAIDCFSWEMELNPTDPKPVQWLTKIYREMGMIEESKAYQQIYSSM